MCLFASALNRLLASVRGVKRNHPRYAMLNAYIHIRFCWHREEDAQYYIIPLLCFGSLILAYRSHPQFPATLTFPSVRVLLCQPKNTCAIPTPSNTLSLTHASLPNERTSTIDSAPRTPPVRAVHGQNQQRKYRAERMCLVSVLNLSSHYSVG